MSRKRGDRPISDPYLVSDPCIVYGSLQPHSPHMKNVNDANRPGKRQIVVQGVSKVAISPGGNNSPVNYTGEYPDISSLHISPPTLELQPPNPSPVNPSPSSMTPSLSPVNPSPLLVNPSPLLVNPKLSSVGCPCQTAVTTPLTGVLGTGSSMTEQILSCELKKMMGSVTKVKEWSEEMELDVKEDVGVVQNTQLELETETYEGYLPLAMNDAGNNNCHNGHTLCSSCKARALNKCLSCMQQLGNIRCLALEKMAMSLELHCKYEEFGCPEIIPYYAKCKHEDSCNFRPYSCPCSGWECSVVGDIPLLVSHLTDYHKAVMFNSCDFELGLLTEDLREHSGCRWIAAIINCYGKYFCVHTEACFQASTPICVVFLSLIGNQAEACNYSCSLEIGGNGRKLTFEGIPRSIRESERWGLESADSLIVLGSMVHSLGGETREPKLEITGRIRKSQIPVCACVDKTG